MSNTKRTYEDILNDWTKNLGTSDSKQYKEEYEMLKLENDRKRNIYLFWITILVAVATIGNLILAISTFILTQQTSIGGSG